MEVGSLTGLSVSEDQKCSCDSSVDPEETSPSVVENLSIDLSEYLNIRDNAKGLPSIHPSGKHGVEKKDACREPCSCEFTSISSEKCLSKSESFPSAIKALPSAAASVGGGKLGLEKNITDDIATEGLDSQYDSAKSIAPSYSRSISLPTPQKLVSAMKGSREKLGVPPQKLGVKWAPDVYDPTPTSMSHVVSSNKPQKHGKKNSKTKQKSKSSRGSKSKDKKQARKHGGSSSKGFKVINYGEEEADFREPFPSGVDFLLSNPDPFCGSSFFRKSVASLHFSVAEAT